MTSPTSSPASPARLAPPAVPVRDRPPLDVDPLDFARRRVCPPPATCAFGPPPPSLEKEHRPGVLDRVLVETRRRLREPVHEITGPNGPTFEWRGVLRFRHRPDGSALALAIGRRCPDPCLQPRHAASSLSLDRLDADDGPWAADMRARIQRAHVRGDVLGQAPSSAYLDWACAQLREALAQEGLWEVHPDTPVELGFDPALLAIARRVRTHPEGHTATLAAYNAVVRRRDEFLRLANDNPSLSMLYATFRDDARFPADGEPISRLRRFFLGIGLSPALWRRVAAPSDGERILPTTNLGFDAPRHVEALLRAADEFGPQFDPPPWMLEELVAQWNKQGDRLLARRPQVRPLLRRLALLHQRGTEDERTLVQGVIETLLGGFLEFDHVYPPSMRRASLLELVFGVLGGAAARRDPKLRWPTPFERIEIDGCEIVALGDSRALREEGRAMEHCAANFAWRCHAGGWLLCSIRGSMGAGTRWTGSFYRCEGRWRLDCIRGFRNLEPPDEMECIGHAIASRMGTWQPEDGPAEPRPRADPGPARGRRPAGIKRRS